VVRSKFAVLVLITLFVFSFISSTFALSERERQFLLMYFDEEDLVIVSTTRSLKSIDKVAENVEVVTAAEIELMNAHTLADVLNTVNGVQVYFRGASPVSIANITVQGSNYEHVAFFLDGVPLRFAETNLAVASDIPVQMIEKIEIIKGPASSAWGSSLGGVVNILTKSPGNKEIMGGTVSASYGERSTMDIRVEGFGKKNKIGYYLTAGRLSTDGLRSEEEGWQNNVYAKLTYDLSSDTSLLFTLGYDRKNRERSDTSALDWLDRDKFRRLYSTLSLNTSLIREVDLAVSLYTMRQSLDYYDLTLSTGDLFRYKTDESLNGVSAKLSWRYKAHNIVAGSDYDEGEVETDFYGSDLRRWAIFANDTVVFGKLAVTPGLRYDNANVHNGFLSPSLGVTYELTDKTILRALVSRGFNAPSIGSTVSDWGFFTHNPNLKVEQVLSYQAGMETGILRYVWLKVTGFRHDVKDGITWEGIDDSSWTYVNKDKVRRQGVEFEIKTTPVFNTTLSAGAIFIEAEDRSTGEEIKDIAKNTYDISLHYNDKKSFSALLQGRYIWFNSEGTYNPKDRSFIFNLNLTKKIYSLNDNTAELFLTGHNIFNSSQYDNMFYKNARRWIEAGIRYKF
jgi:vitamin B12 transporter